MGNKSRSLIKTASYRITAFIILSLITFYTTNNLIQTTLISVSFQIVQFFMYYIHERVWEQISWGQEQKCPPKLD